ncbi:glycoside hydrolase family 15 protein [Spirosoma oryzicola]|uniref:glycoside hydrolase family 15 protein n=1 Tax=Spirosoma oryzicola TaxID=2898794 RepID=UPI001E3A968F|nr:glycoside hydrolase family 15 protein [Spirosoma oryzicola]UHG94258.1 glycoside hydrolase family 15 protein [Spirosoma oryzicola]
MIRQPQINDLALISDRQTGALLDKQGTISWFCPTRFDAEAVFSLLLDQQKGGYWLVEADDKQFVSRAYHERSSVLTTQYTVAGQPFFITDWMPIDFAFRGICRQFSNATEEITNRIRLKPDYGLRDCIPVLADDSLSVNFPSVSLCLYTSHPSTLEENELVFRIPANETGWAVLVDERKPHPPLTVELLQDSLRHTENVWKQLGSLLVYDGPYEKEVNDSIRAIQQLTYAKTGGIIAAATTSLPEVIGGKRNYDYRFVWMRDVALITGSIVQVDEVGEVEENFLSFMCGALGKNDQANLSPFYSVEKEVIASAEQLELGGYRNSRPVQIGNTASKQLQLDSDANILIAAKLVYDRFGKREHWEAVCKVANFLAENWKREDNGIWEEEVRKHYTTSKAYTARGLEFIAKYADSPAQASYWKETASQIRKFVHDHCMTKQGAFAVYAGSEEVDIAAALFTPWSYTEPDSREMKATVQALETDYCRNHLYWRHLEEFDSKKEGAFLAGTFWMAHHYAIAGNLPKAKAIIEAGLAYQNDLGYFSEEAGINSGEMLGNFPQTFVHSSFICAVNGLKLAMAGKDSRAF